MILFTIAVNGAYDGGFIVYTGPKPMILRAAALLAALLFAAPAVAADPAADDRMGPAAPAQKELAAGLLRAAPSFASLPDTAIAALAERAVPRLLRAGEAVVAEGEASDSLFVLAAGDFAVLRLGSPAPLARLGAGEIIGEYALLTGAPRSATVQAVDTGLVFELTRADMTPVLQQYPGVVSAMSALMAERVARNTPNGPDKQAIAKEIEDAARARLK